MSSGKFNADVIKGLSIIFIEIHSCCKEVKLFIIFVCSFMIWERKLNGRNSWINCLLSCNTEVRSSHKIYFKSCLLKKGLQYINLE